MKDTLQIHLHAVNAVELMKCCGNCYNRHSEEVKGDGITFRVEEYCCVHQEIARGSYDKCEDWKWRK